MLARDDGLHAIDFEEAPGRQPLQVSECEEMCAFGFSPDGATFVIATSPASRSTGVRTKGRDPALPGTGTQSGTPAAARRRRLPSVTDVPTPQSRRSSLPTLSVSCNCRREAGGAQIIHCGLATRGIELVRSGAASE